MEEPEGGAVTHTEQKKLWRPLVRLLLRRKRSGCSRMAEGKGQNQRLRGRSSGNHSLDLLFAFSKSELFSTGTQCIIPQTSYYS